MTVYQCDECGNYFTAMPGVRIASPTCSKWCKFWVKVDRSAGPGKCWPWLGSKCSKGYGHFRRPAPFSILAHRAAWEFVNGEIRGDLCILHACDNPPCCNPGHHSLGTRADNTADMISKGRMRHVHVRGEAQGMAKLTTADVLAIRSRRALGEVFTKIGKSYGINEATVRKIVNRERWSHI
jgi:hypothetical protein